MIGCVLTMYLIFISKFLLHKRKSNFRANLKPLYYN